MTRDFCEQLDGLVGPQLTLLASDICEQFTVNRRISGSVYQFTSTHCEDDLVLFCHNKLVMLCPHLYVLEDIVLVVIYQITNATNERSIQMML